MPERRRDRRYRTNLNCTLIFEGGEIKGVIADISSKGYCVVTKHILPVKSEGKLRVNYMDEFIEMPVQVRWLTALGDKFRVGIQITGVAAHNRDILKKLEKTAEIEDNIKIEKADIGKLKELMQIENRVSPEGLRATENMIMSRLEVFPDGFLCASIAEAICGFISSQIVTYDEQKEPCSWYDATDNGLIAKSHAPDGDTLYIVGISVLPYTESYITTLLLESIGNIVVQMGLKRAIYGCRLPHYHAHADKFTIHEYVNAKDPGGRLLDPGLAMFQKIGMTAFKLVPEYVNDPESLNYGVLMSWNNPFR